MGLAVLQRLNRSPCSIHDRQVRARNGPSVSKYEPPSITVFTLINHVPKWKSLMPVTATAVSFAMLLIAQDVNVPAVSGIHRRATLRLYGRKPPLLTTNRCTMVALTVIRLPASTMSCTSTGMNFSSLMSL